MQMLAIDLAKQSFHVHGVSADGEIISRRVTRQKLMVLVENLNPKLIAMEACATAHYWARMFIASGRDVRLINPRFVKPFVRGSKNDAVDAEAIFDAASRPTMRFVPVKTEAQQDLQSLHRVRDRLVGQRTSLINHLRGLLAEYGLIYPKGAALFLARARASLQGASLSPMAVETFGALVDELEALEARIERLDERLRSICRDDDTCRRLMTLPGVGPVVATALAASVGDARQFRSGRELAAWIGLVPRQVLDRRQVSSCRCGETGEPLSAPAARSRRASSRAAPQDKDRSAIAVAPGRNRSARLQQGHRGNGEQDCPNGLGHVGQT